jgi:hypothetical protein
MKVKNSKGEVPLRNCLQIVVEVMKSKIVADDNSYVGLTLFGTVSITLNKLSAHKCNGSHRTCCG